MRYSLIFFIFLLFVSLPIIAQPAILIEYLDIPTDQIASHDNYEANELQSYFSEKLAEKKVYAWYHYGVRFPAGQRAYNRVNVTVFTSNAALEERPVLRYQANIWDTEIARPDYEMRSPGYGTFPAPYISVDFLGLGNTSENGLRSFLSNQVKPVLDEKVSNGQLLNYSMFKNSDNGKQPKAYDRVIVTRYWDYGGTQAAHPLAEGNPGVWVKSQIWQLLAIVYPEVGAPLTLPTDTLAARQTVLKFIQAIDQLDPQGLAEVYAKNAEVFYPFTFTTQRLSGREKILKEQKKGFAWARQHLAGKADSSDFTLGLTPAQMKTTLLSSGSALVTWHSPRATHLGRRTAVLRHIGGRWWIVHHHASNMATSE